MRDPIRPITSKMLTNIKPSNNWIEKRSVFIEKSKKPFKQITINGDEFQVNTQDIMEGV